MDLQNRGKLLSFKQGNLTAMQYLYELRQLYSLTNYPDQVNKETLLRDLFISGITSSEARRILFQEDADTLSLDRCLHLVSTFESVQTSTLHSEQSQADLSVSAISKKSKWLAGAKDAVNSQVDIFANIVQPSGSPVIHVAKWDT